MNKEELIKKLTDSSKVTAPKQTEVLNSSKWFSDAIKRLNKEKNIDRRFTPGSMFSFYYDPIHKDKLPYYDTFPLVILLKKTKDGFLGLNLHYIPPKIRALILLNLIKNGLIVESSADDIIRFKITYNILERLSVFKFFKPCIKEYKFEKIHSRIINIKSDEWDNVINLPFERFVKESKQRVWKESLSQRTSNRKD